MILALFKDFLQVSTSSSSQDVLCLKIDFKQLDIIVSTSSQEDPIAECQFLGILGLTKLNSSSFLIMAVAAQEVGRIDGGAVNCLEKISFIPLTYSGAFQTFQHVKQQLSAPVQKRSSSTDLDEIETILPEVKKFSISASMSSLMSQAQQYAASKPQTAKNVSVEEEAPKATISSKMAHQTSEYLKFLQDKRIIVDISAYLCSGTFFYSLEYDITNSEQRKLYRPRSQSLFGHLDLRFWWNKHLCASFLYNVSSERFVIPIMQGFVAIQSCQIDNHHFEYVLISRRSCARNGLRYLRRGVDAQGEVANFVETEQKIKFHGSILEVADTFMNPRHQKAHVASFVQVRGSIPLYWTQNAQSRKPLPELKETAEENQKALQKHFDLLRKLYGQVQAVNLVESEGKEAVLQQAFRRSSSSAKDVLYQEFDVHKECKGMRYENLSKLVDQVQTFVTDTHYFWRSDDAVLMSQKGVLRINCVDCLDRTNVVQSLLARHVLNNQLLRLGVHSQPEQGLTYFADFERLFQCAWADNGDAISMAYTNTSALKGDVTRTGKRQWSGMLNDGGNSLYRLFQNNFLDAFRQSIIDYFLGVISFETFTGQVIKEAVDYEEEANTTAEFQALQVIQLRKEALDQARGILLMPDEYALAQDVVLSFALNDKKNSFHIREQIFILTAELMYIAQYHVELDKVTAFKCIPLEKVTQIRKGSLVAAKELSSLYGIAIYYQADESMQDRKANTLTFQLKQKPIARQYEFFAISDIDLDHSQSVAEQLVARIATQVLLIPEHERAKPETEFVVDSNIDDLLPKKLYGLVNKFRSILSKSPQK